jgi:hypothetical protein
LRFARYVFGLAGIYGLLVLAPQYFLESRISTEMPPAITHAEYFYGFIGLGLVWQLGFLLIASDPRRYRPLMLLGVLEKLSFVLPVGLLYVQGRVGTQALGFSLIDLMLGILFLAAFRATRMR